MAADTNTWTEGSALHQVTAGTDPALTASARAYLTELLVDYRASAAAIAAVLGEQ